MDNDTNTIPKSKENRSFLARVFISPDEPRLRAGWRVLAQLILLVVIVFFIGFLAQLLIQYGLNEYLGSFIVVLAITTSVFMGRRFLDRRTFVSLGLKLNSWTLMDLLVGFAVGGLMIGLIFYLESALGWLTIEKYAWQNYPLEEVRSLMIGMLVTFIFVGWQEELISRGYLLQNLIDGLNVFWGVMISSFLFGLLHLANPNSSIAGAVGTFLLGIFLSYAYLATRQLWLPIGLHIGWNFFEGPIFGYPVSGVDAFRLLQQSVNGPSLVTGGSFGPEAGLILLVGLVLGVGTVYAYSRFRSNSVKEEGKSE
jgi:membrane protease YdiL (CAAX protease family)